MTFPALREGRFPAYSVGRRIEADAAWAVGAAGQGAGVAMTIKMITSIVVAMIAIAGAVSRMNSSGGKFSKAARAGDTATATTMATDDPWMVAAHSLARASLPEFLRTLASPDAGMGSFAVKVGVDTPRGKELVWLASPTARGDQVSGVLQGSPRYATMYKEGQVAQFPQASVLDWKYADAGKVRGNLTACAAAAGYSEQDRKNYERERHLDCSRLFRR